MKTFEIINNANEVYNLLNEFITQGVTPLLGRVFPEHDGKADHAAAADMVELRQSLRSLEIACEIGIKHLSEVIATYEEAMQ